MQDNSQQTTGHPPRAAFHHTTPWQNDKRAHAPLWAKNINLPTTSVLDIDGFDAEAFIRSTLAEDLGEAGDITATAVIPEEAVFSGVMASREPIVIAGLPLAAAFFKALDPSAEIEIIAKEGAYLPAGQTLLKITGKARALLECERSALNLCQHLSGIATMTRHYVEAIKGTGTVLLDTRKTIPGLRLLEKYATRMGGAQNHRMGLDDGAMIKDNHIAVAGNVALAVRRAVEAAIPYIIVEIDNLEQIPPALKEGATHLLLDNMAPETLKKAVSMVGGRVPTEASGGVNLDNIRSRAETGVTYISVGRLTQSAPAVDIGLDFSLLPSA